MESERRNPCAVVGESGDSGLYFSLFSWKFFAGLPFAEDFFEISILCRTFAPAFEHRIELWCNGNTADFGSVVPGSSPGSSTLSFVAEVAATGKAGFQNPAFLFSCMAQAANRRVGSDVSNA